MNKIIIDVREPNEFAGGHVDSAINIPTAKVVQNPPELANIDKDTEIILYCVSGGRAGRVASILSQQGYTNVVNGINKSFVEANFK